MSRKNRFKKRAKYAVENTLQEKPKFSQEIAKNEYNMKPEFINLGIIMLLFIGALAGLYYYDKQSNVLEAMAKKLFSLF